MMGPLALLALVLLLAACAPAPVGNVGPAACDRVRAWVADGTLPLDLALQWYSHCAPFEVRP